MFRRAGLFCREPLFDFLIIFRAIVHRGTCLFLTAFFRFFGNQAFNLEYHAVLMARIVVLIKKERDWDEVEA
jgi:hypothetical protein